jgi:hypothetical protein
MDFSHIDFSQLDRVLQVMWDSGYQQPCIVGGAVRDTILGRPVKDYDVFVHHTTDLPDQFWEQAETRSEYSDLSEDRELVVVARNNGEIEVEGIPIDILIGPSIEKFIDSFDFGLCKVAYAGTPGRAILLTPDEFIADYTNKTLTLLPSAHNYQAHMERMIEKFPDYKFVDLKGHVPKVDKTYKETEFLYT